MIDSFISRIACNSYIVFNDKKEGFLIDPGYNKGNCLIEHIKKLGVDIKAVLITHAHYDHITALKDVVNEFNNPAVYIFRDEFDILTNPRLNLSNIREDGDERILDFSPNNIILLDDGEKFNVAGFEIEVIHTPFHTKGSVCYLVNSESALFSGDTLFFTTIGRSDLPTGSERTISSSLSKLLVLPDYLKVYPGHGIATSLEREKKYNSYLKNI